jgi:vitamin B12 transporter
MRGRAHDWQLENSMPERITLAGLLAGAVLALPVEAAETLEPVVVTASRGAQSIDDALAPVIIITREDIEQSLAIDVAELLRFHAGLDIARTGGAGAQTSLFTRGTESDHTLIMIDGVKLTPGTTGGAAIQHIDPELIERIEIIKGPRSTLWGSEAIGGVVHIITRRDKAAGTRMHATLGLAENNTREFSGGVSHNNDKLRAGFDVSVKNTEGFPARRSSSIDNDNRNTNVNAYIGTVLGNGLDIELSHWQASGRNEYLNFLLNPLDQDFDLKSTSLTLKKELSDRWASSLKLSAMRDELSQNQSSAVARTRRNVVDWQNDVQLDAFHLLTFGITNENETAENGYDEKTRTTAGYVQGDMQYGKHHALLAARHTDHEDFGTHNTWNAEYGYQATAKLRLLAGVGTAFRAPSGNDRFGFGGNPDLQPEKSRNLELGLRYKPDARQSFGVSAFDNRIDNLINVVYVGPGFFDYQAQNTNKARIKGIEFNYEYKHGPWYARAEAIFQKPWDESNDALLLRRAKRSITATLGYTRGDYQLGMDVLASGSREDFDATTFARKDLGGYTLVNLTGSMKLDRDWSLHGRIENIFDEQYELVDDYTTPGRTVGVQLRYSPKGS